MIPRQNGHLNLGYGNTKTNTVAPWIEELARGLVPGWFPLTCTEGVRSGTAAPAPPRSSLLRSREQAALAALAGLLGDSCVSASAQRAVEREVRAVPMVQNSLAVPSGFVGFLKATKDHTSTSPTNTQKSSMSLWMGRQVSESGALP